MTKVVLLFCLMFVIAGTPSVQGGLVNLNGEELQQGELLIVQVETTEYMPRGVFDEDQLYFIPWNMGWIAFYGVSYWREPGTYNLTLQLGEREVVQEVNIRDGNFPESHITVSEEQERLIRPEEDDQDILDRRSRDRDAVQEAYAQPITRPLWEEEFTLPTTGRRTTGFGHTRYVNNEFNNRHAGIDIANVQGTPIKSVNQGVVKLAEELLVAGKTIIIDHGGRVFSSYSHLSKIEVEVGQTVARGEKIGEMGSTGFSTGPHLHWEMRTPEAPLDPDLFIGTDLFSLPLTPVL